MWDINEEEKIKLYISESTWTRDDTWNQIADAIITDLQKLRIGKNQIMMSISHMLSKRTATNGMFFSLFITTLTKSIFPWSS